MLSIVYRLASFFHKTKQVYACGSVFRRMMWFSPYSISLYQLLDTHKLFVAIH